MLEVEATMDTPITGASRVGTLGHQLDCRLARLLATLGQGEHARHALRVARVLSQDWRDEAISSGPRWPSDITDDHSPFEFSLAMTGRSESLRILTEPQGRRRFSLSASWARAADIHEEIAQRWNVDLANYHQIAELFAPAPTATGLFSIWHSAILGKTRNTQFKVYLNPAIHGVDNAVAIVTEAFDRLGLGQAWTQLSAQVLRRGKLDQLLYFSLDLSDKAEARAKVYVAHREASAEDVSRATEGCPGFETHATSRWFQHVLGGSGPFRERPPITCFALARGTLDLHTTTLHLPIRCYARDDFEVARRVCALLSFPQRVRYMRALTEFAERPLESGPGLQTYVSLRPSPGRQAVTVYMAPQVYSNTSKRERQACGAPAACTPLFELAS